MDTRAGHYTRQLQTKAGDVGLKVPKLGSLPFETAIIERYKRRERSVEEALWEMYYAGVSMRRVEDITEALWGSRVSSITVGELNQKVAGQIKAWRTQPIEGEHAYVFVDGIWLKRSRGGAVVNARRDLTHLWPSKIAPLRDKNGGVIWSWSGDLLWWGRRVGRRSRGTGR